MRRKRRGGYQRSIAASVAMEDYMTGRVGRKAIARNYRKTEKSCVL